MSRRQYSLAGDDDDSSDALPPPIAFSSSSGRASRASISGARPQVTEDRRRRAPKTPNDVRVKPASLDVMNGLLSSFDVITPTPDADMMSDRDYSRPPSSFRQSRPSSRTSTHMLGLLTEGRSSRTSTLRQANNPYDTADKPYTVADQIEMLLEEEGAEPPVVRTSRPPSGLSRVDGSSTARAWNLPSPRSFVSPADNGRRSAASVRPSNDYARRGTDTAEPAVKTRSRFNEDYDPRADSIRSAATETQRRRRVVLSSSQTTHASATSSARISLDIGRPSGMASRTPAGEPAHRDPSLTVHEQEYMETADGRLVPVRRSSLRQQTSNYSMASSSDRSHRQSSVTSDQTARLQALGASPVGRVIMNEEAEDNDVSRRIKELLVQRDARIQSEGHARSNGVPANGRTSASTKDKTAPHLGEGPARPPAVEEHRISDELERQQDNYSLAIPIKQPIVESKPFMRAPRTRPAVGTMSPVSLSAPRASSEQSRPSRQHSFSRRWAPAAFGNNRSEASRKPESERSQSSLTLGNGSMDARRTSMDSVRASVKGYLASARLTQKVEIPGQRRRVAFSEVGDPEGAVVLCCVGMGLTRYIMAFYDELARSLNLRLITLDRPGVGESDAYSDGPRTPMSWPDDVQAICDHLRVTKFSMLAHSAGAIYALATAIRLPQYLHGKIHLLAPWIPPSQLVQDSRNVDPTTSPVAALPRSQRFLRLLPSSFLRLSNASFAFGNRNAATKPSKAGRRQRATETPIAAAQANNGQVPADPVAAPTMSATQPPSPQLDGYRQLAKDRLAMAPLSRASTNEMPNAPGPDASKKWQKAYDEELIPMIWELATTNANPSVDLLICLERHRTIGFSYADVGAIAPTKTLGEKPGRVLDLEVDGNLWPGMGIVIRHGSKDSRVPVENVRWLGQKMVKCEVIVLDGLGHGLMGEAGVMGSVLTDISKEWAANASSRTRRGPAACR